MKKGLIITLIVLVILVLVTFTIFILVNKNISNKRQGVTITIEKGTLTRTSATIILDCKNDYSYKEWYRIDRKENGEWKSLTQIGKYSQTLLGMLPEKYGKGKDKIDWTERYGELENGEYRLMKSVSTNGETREIYVEFTIE